jgi:hypothetical protein
MRDRKPVTTDEMYVVLALFMLMGIIQKPTLRSHFQKVLFWQLLSLAVISMDWFESICNYMHFSNSEGIATHKGPSRLFKIYPVQYHLNTKFQFVHFRHHNKNGRNCVVTCGVIVEKRPHAVDE